MPHPVRVMEVEPSPDATWKVGLLGWVSYSVGAVKDKGEMGGKREVNVWH